MKDRSDGLWELVGDHLRILSPEPLKLFDNQIMNSL